MRFKQLMSFNYQKTQVCRDLEYRLETFRAINAQDL